jgi:hypothetical protein
MSPNLCYPCETPNTIQKIEEKTIMDGHYAFNIKMPFNPANRITVISTLVSHRVCHIKCSLVFLKIIFYLTLKLYLDYILLLPWYITKTGLISKIKFLLPAPED